MSRPTLHRVYNPTPSLCDKMSASMRAFIPSFPARCIPAQNLM